jgi:DNA primase
MTAIDEIKARIDIVDLVSTTVQLRRSGKNYTGFCPFHSNTRTPAFVVFQETGTWRCFGQCNEGGDIFKYVMKKEGVDFSEALRILADKAGVQLKPPSPEAQQAAEEHAALRELLEEAVTFYRHNLLSTPAGQQALEYMRHKRGLNDEIIEAFGLGYAPQSWDASLRYFQSRGHSIQDLLDTGLVTEREQGADAGVYDRFRNRLMFPIRNERGQMAGFGARILDPQDIPKFLNSPQTDLFDKGHLLYGLDQARKAIREQDQVVIVEGYLDVIALHQHGFTNVVSPMGTALTEDQLFLIKRFTRRIVLALDSDAAGDKATLRGLQLARQAMDHTQELSYDARGLLGYEARLQADIRVTTLPEGMDPDDVVNQDRQAWVNILERANPIVIHVMESLAAGRDLQDPKVKSEIAAQVLPLIEDVADSIERDTYRQQLARLLRVDERTLLGAGKHARPRPDFRRRPESSQPAKVSAAQSPVFLSAQALETHCLGILLRRPDLLYKMDRELQQEGLPRLQADDFQQVGHQTIFSLIHESVDQDMAEPLNFVLGNLTLDLMDLADDLLERTDKFNPRDERVLDDLLRGVIDMRMRGLKQSIDYLRYLMEEDQEKGDPKASQYQQAMVQHTHALQRLNQARERFTSRPAVPRP